MRFYPYITLGKILDELWEERRAAGASEEMLWRTTNKGKRVKLYSPSRITIVRREKNSNFSSPSRTNSGKYKWRIYSREEANKFKQRIKDEYLF